MKSQMKLLLQKDDSSHYRVSVDQVSPRGCSFQWSHKDIAIFRENNQLAGKFCTFDLEMVFFLPSVGDIAIKTEGQVCAIHRCAQDEYQIKLTFANMQQDGYRLIAEYMAQQNDVMAQPGVYSAVSEAKSA